MIIDILNSSIDPAGKNIRSAIDQFIENEGEKAFPLFDGNEITFHTTDERIINIKRNAVNPDADLVIIVSRHSSVNPVPVLTVHPAGNYGIAQLGGNNEELGLTSPAWMKSILQNHTRFVPEGYRVSYEITHHGPTDLPMPFFFVEVGSTQKEWGDEKAYSAVAKSVLFAKPATESIPLIGFGGTHYAVRQTAIGIDTKGAMGHMMHTRDVANATREIVQQMIEKSGSAVAAHVDRKALSKGEIAHIEEILKTLDIPEITEGELQKLNHIDYPLWLKYRRLAGKDVRLYPHGIITGEEPETITLPEDFFSAAFGKDEEPLLAYLDKEGGVFHTTNNSGKILPLFLTDKKNRKNIAGGLIALTIQYITRKLDSTIDGDTIILRKKQFDAQKARKLGVPSGPLFGKLSAGETIQLEDGKTVTPEEVTTITTTSIKIPGLE